MAFYHGISTNEKATALAAPTEISVGITFAVGTAPVQQVGGAANKVKPTLSLDSTMLLSEGLTLRR